MSLGDGGAALPLIREAFLGWDQHPALLLSMESGERSFLPLQGFFDGEVCRCYYAFAFWREATGIPRT